MSLWSRFKRTVQRVLSIADDTPTFDPGDLPSRDRDYSRDDDRESLLPPGWRIAGLYHEGEQTTRIDATDDTEVTDSDIAHADAVIVQYGPGGSDGYKWIHGADDWRSIADQIEITIIVVSPKGTGA